MKIIICLLTAVLINTGCLSGALTGKINKQEEVGREWRETTFRGRQSGIIKVDDKQYQKYEFCGFQDDPQRILEVWIPLEEGNVILDEHRNYLLEGELPLVMKTAFETKTDFKGMYYQQVNYDGEEMKIMLPENPPETEPNIPPIIQLPEGIRVKPQELQFNNPDIYKKNARFQGFIRPEGSQNWYLVTTRINHPLTLSHRTGTKYYLSTSESRYEVNAENMHYDYRSRTGNILLKSAYILTVPVDIVITPVIVIGVGIYGFFASITN